MKTKEFLRGLLKENQPQVIEMKNGEAQALALSEENVADFIGGLSMMEKYLLRTRINRHQLSARYDVDHVQGIGKEEIQKRIMISEFWNKLANIAAPCFKKK